MGDPGEGHEVVLAHRPQLDVAHQHHLVVPDVEGGGEHVLGTLAQTRRQLGVGPGDARRGVVQALPLRVLTDREEQLADGGLGARVVELGDLALDEADRVGHGASVQVGGGGRLGVRPPGCRRGCRRRRRAA